jgi:phenylalanine-4-hydroxylase
METASTRQRRYHDSEKPTWNRVVTRKHDLARQNGRTYFIRNLKGSRN